MIGSVLLWLLVIHFEVSDAMQVYIGSSEWEGGAAVSERRRMVLDSQTPLESPVPSRHSRTNHSLVAAIVVLMVLATAALIGCCYIWEQQLRVRMEARNHREPASLSSQDSGGGSSSTHHYSNSRMVSASPSTVIVLIGDDRPGSMAWAIPPMGIPAVAPARLPQAGKENSVAPK